MLGVAAHTRVTRSINDVQGPVHLANQYLRYNAADFAYIMTAGTVISVWVKRDTVSAGGTVIGHWILGTAAPGGAVGPRFFQLNMGSFGGAIDIGATQFQMFSYHEGSGGGINDQINFVWDDFPNDTNWHHVLMYQSASGRPTTVTLYVDGVSLGTKSNNSAILNAYSQRMYKVIGIGRNAFVNEYGDPVLIQPTPSLPGGYAQRGSGVPVWSFTVNQLWIGTVTSFNINDFYQSGFVYLGTDGRTGGTQVLPTPAYYNQLVSLTGLDLIQNDIIIN